jgi:hypothetical protein
MEETSARLNLAVTAGNEAATLVELTTYATTLVMNYLTHGSFIPRARRSRPGRRGEPTPTELREDPRHARP